MTGKQHPKPLPSQLICVVQAVSQIAVGPRLLDFGKVSAASRNTRYLAVTNPLLQSIHIVLAVANLPELRDCEHVSQVTALCPSCAPSDPCFTGLFCLQGSSSHVLRRAVQCCGHVACSVCVVLCKRAASLLMMHHRQEAKLALALLSS